jgi:hypothetical protein
MTKRQVLLSPSCSKDDLREQQPQADETEKEIQVVANVVTNH